MAGDTSAHHMIDSPGSRRDKRNQGSLRIASSSTMRTLWQRLVTAPMHAPARQQQPQTLLSRYASRSLPTRYSLASTSMVLSLVEMTCFR